LNITDSVMPSASFAPSFFAPAHFTRRAVVEVCGGVLGLDLLLFASSSAAGLGPPGKFV
jgi:hypothetical protein